MIIDSVDSFRSKDGWLKFLPNVVAAKESEKKVKETEIDPDLKESLKAAWRYTNLLEQADAG